MQYQKSGRHGLGFLFSDIYRWAKLGIALVILGVLFAYSLIEGPKHQPSMKTIVSESAVFDGSVVHRTVSAVQSIDSKGLYFKDRDSVYYARFNNCVNIEGIGPSDYVSFEAVMHSGVPVIRKLHNHRYRSVKIYCSLAALFLVIAYSGFCWWRKGAL